MVKAGKHTLALASRYSPIAGSGIRRTEARRSISTEVCLKSEGARTPGTPPVLRNIRAEFCRKYKSKIQSKTGSYSEDSESETVELRNLYCKLREVVPNLTESGPKPVTSLDVVLGAIDYIRDLHQMLEGKFPSPAGLPTVTSTPLPSVASVRNSGRSPLTQLENRRPELMTTMESPESSGNLPPQ